MRRRNWLHRETVPRCALRLELISGSPVSGAPVAGAPRRRATASPPETPGTLPAYLRELYVGQAA